jgi:hypothetical protein
MGNVYHENIMNVVQLVNEKIKYKSINQIISILEGKPTKSI